VKRVPVRVKRPRATATATASATMTMTMTVTFRACVSDTVAVRGEAPEWVILLRQCKGRAREWQVHFFASEESRAGRELLARERPVALALSPPAYDEHGGEGNYEDGKAGDGGAGYNGGTRRETAGLRGRA